VGAEDRSRPAKGRETAEIPPKTIGEEEDLLILRRKNKSARGNEKKKNRKGLNNLLLSLQGRDSI